MFHNKPQVALKTSVPTSLPAPLSPLPGPPVLHMCLGSSTGRSKHRRLALPSATGHAAPHRTPPGTLVLGAQLLSTPLPPEPDPALWRASYGKTRTSLQKDRRTLLSGAGAQPWVRPGTLSVRSQDSTAQPLRKRLHSPGTEALSGTCCAWGIGRRSRAESAAKASFSSLSSGSRFHSHSQTGENPQSCTGRNFKQFL